MLKKVLLSLAFIPTLHASAPAVATTAEQQSRRALAQLDMAANLMDELKGVLDQYRNEQITIQKARQMATNVLNEYRPQARGPLLGVVEALRRMVEVAVKSRTPFLSAHGTKLAETFKGTDPEQIKEAIEEIKTAPGKYTAKDLQYAAAVAKKQAQQAALADAIKSEDEQTKKWFYQRAVGDARERFSRYWWGDPATQTGK